MKTYKYSPHFKDNDAEGHIFIAGIKGACTITLTGASAMSQRQLNKIGRKIATLLNNHE
jgi:hypothetical protein